MSHLPVPLRAMPPAFARPPAPAAQCPHSFHTTCSIATCASSAHGLCQTPASPHKSLLPSESVAPLLPAERPRALPPLPPKPCAPCSAEIRFPIGSCLLGS